MNINELQQIGEIISSMGDMSTTAFVYYLVASYSMKLIYASIVGGVFIGIYKLITKGINESLPESFQRQIRDGLGVGKPGPMTARERKDILKEMKRLKSLDK